MNDETNCPLCESPIELKRLSKYTIFECGSCAAYAISHGDYAQYLFNRDSKYMSPSKRLRIAAVLREKWLRLQTKIVLKIRDSEYLHSSTGSLPSAYLDELLSEFPTTVPQKLDRTLGNIAAQSAHGGCRVTVSIERLPPTFSEHRDEPSYILDCLEKQSLISTTGTKGAGDERYRSCCLEPEGWTRYLEINQSSPRNPVFVAMWFGGEERQAEMNKLFMDSIAPGIEKAGYKAQRADTDEHNSPIMDKVLGDIRRAPFVVSDLTNDNSGVYYEAGFATGLGIPVIFTQKKEEENMPHFDVRHINTIYYTSAADLSTKLTNRIRGSLGEGPFKKTMT